MKRIQLRSSNMCNLQDWMLTRALDLYEDEILADGHLRNASLLDGNIDNKTCNYFRRENLPRAVAVLRFHGFEVEVEE